MTESVTAHTRPARDNLRLALEVPRWALRFYIRRLPLVAGISLIPAAERFAVALWGDAWSLPVHIALEILAEGTRVILLVILVRIAILKDEQVRLQGHVPAGRRIKAFLDRRWPSLLLQGVLLLALAAVFNVIPEQVVPLWLPEETHDLYWGSLLAVKNVTIIAFTFIWMVGAARQMLIEGGRMQPDPPEPTRT